ncbi:MAG: TonB-dependent receptor [Bryobacterales bacterium]|nr:TonB-dependent receptor [Bryobacterales bacterium]
MLLGIAGNDKRVHDSKQAMWRWIGVVLSITVLVGLLSVPAAIAQTSTGTISGTVSDQNEGVMPNATVTIMNTLTGNQRRIPTNETGIFVFNSLPVGNYRLVVEAPGFKTYNTEGIRLDVSDRLHLMVRMEVGETTQSVTVQSEVGGLQTESADLSNLIAPAQIQNLPLSGRVYSQVLDLFPGISPEGGRMGAGTGLSADTAVSINGGQSNSNVWMMDGVSNMGLGSNNGNAVTPSADAIEEFRVLRGDYSAEYGGGTGGIVNVVTKAGTQQFHGSAFEYMRNDKLDAADFFLNSSGGTKSKLRQHDFGFTLGGPFWIPGGYNRDKTKDFFFFSFEGRRESRGVVQVGTVPSARQRIGILDPTCSVSTGPCTPQAFDPMEQPVDGENVPQSLIDPNSTAMLARYPLPNTTFADHGFNWIDSPNNYVTNNQEMGRWDHNFTDNTRLMFRYVQEDQGATNYQDGWTDDQFPSVNSDLYFASKNLVANLTKILSPRMLNVAQFGYSARPCGLVDGKTSDPKLLSREGYTYTELFPETSGSWPRNRGFDGFDSLKHRSNYRNDMEIFQVRDNFSYTMGAHNFKAGFDWSSGRLGEPANGSGDFTAGYFKFRDTYSMLLGKVRSYSEEQTKNVVPSRLTDLGIYVADTWKVTRSLTLDMGLRWQYLGPARSAKDNISNFYASVYDRSRCSISAFDEDGLVDPERCDTMNGIVTPGSPNAASAALVERHFQDWEPRLGIAWTPFASRRFVIRTGGGIFHGRDAGSLTSALGLPPPYNRTVELSSLTFAALSPGRLSPFNPETPQAPTFLQTLDPVYKTPTSYQYSFGVQYELAPRSTIDVSYVGSRQIHQGRNRDINQVPAQYRKGVFDGDVLPDLVRPYLGYTSIYVNERVGTTRYNSLQGLFSHRMGKGLTFQAAYAWGTTISTAGNRDSEAIDSAVYDAYNPGLEKGFASADQRHSLTFNYNWELPFFESAGGLTRSLLGGWQLSGVTALRSGLPASVCSSGGYAGLFGNECERTDLIAKPNLSRGERSLLHYFNTDAFVLQEPGTIGNASKGVVRMPGVSNWDISAFKEFRLPLFPARATGEEARLQLRADFFNAFNHTQFCGVNTDFIPLRDSAGSKADPDSGFGAVNCARAPREVQLGLRLVW